MQHEREALGRRQRVEDDEQREPDRVGEDRLVLGIGVSVDGDDRLGEPAAEVVLTAGAARAKDVERDARHDGRQPAREVRDAVRVRAGEPQPRLLDRVFSLAHRAEHPVRDRPQVAAMSLELLRQQVALAHRHILSLGSVICLTNDIRPM